MLVQQLNSGVLADRITSFMLEKDPFRDVTDKAAGDCIRRVNMGYIDARLLEVQREINEAQESKDEGRWRSLQQKKLTLVSQLKEINSGRTG